MIILFFLLLGYLLVEPWEQHDVYYSWRLAKFHIETCGANKNWILAEIGCTSMGKKNCGWLRYGSGVIASIITMNGVGIVHRLRSVTAVTLVLSIRTTYVGLIFVSIAYFLVSSLLIQHESHPPESSGRTHRLRLCRLAEHGCHPPHRSFYSIIVTHWHLAPAALQDCPTHHRFCVPVYMASKSAFPSELWWRMGVGKECSGWDRENGEDGAVRYPKRDWIQSSVTACIVSLYDMGRSTATVDNDDRLQHHIAVLSNRSLSFEPYYEDQTFLPFNPRRWPWRSAKIPLSAFISTVVSGFETLYNTPRAVPSVYAHPLWLTKTIDSISWLDPLQIMVLP